jgi:putative ABC transport system permease protein
MILRDFRIGWRIGWRLLLKESGYSLAVVPGLAVCFLPLGFVRYCFTYNAQIPGSEHIFGATALALRN